MANLAEMCKLEIPVPPFYNNNRDLLYSTTKTKCNILHRLSRSGCCILKTEAIMNMKFGDKENRCLSLVVPVPEVPCLMMETVLNIGLCSETIPGLIKKTQNPRFVYDAYRRLIMMYSDVVMEKAENIEPEEGKGIRVQLDKMLHELKVKKGYKSDTDLTTEDLIQICDDFKKKIVDVLGKSFPDNAYEQLWGGIGAVFKSWNGKRAISYRRIEGIPDEWNCVMFSNVFGNMVKIATGVLLKKPSTEGKILRRC